MISFLQDSTFLFQILLFFIVMFLIKWFAFSKMNSKNLPPSPKKLPILGNLHQLGSILHRSLRSLAQKHGPLILLQMGGVQWLVVSSSAAAQEIMKTHDKIFSNRVQSTISNKLLYGSKDITFSNYGDYWRQMRSFAIIHLLNPKKVQNFRRAREEEVALMVEKIRETSLSSMNHLVNLSDFFMSLPNDLICRLVMGRKIKEGDDARKFKGLLKEFVEFLGRIRVGDYIPWLSFVDWATGFDAKLDSVAKGFNEIFDQLLGDHIETKKMSDEKDFLGILLDSHKEKEMSGFEMDSVKALILDMLSAGTDTTYTMLEWVVAELLCNPETMKKLEREIRDVARNKSKITEDDLEKMKYLKAVIKEALRLHPPLPLLIPRQLLVDINIMGYDISAGTHVVINAWAIGRNESFWENPEEFHPERFLNSHIDYKGQNFEFIPFGAGRRGCPGLMFAIALGELTLANLIQKFVIALPNGVNVEDLNMSESKGVTAHMKTPLVVVITPRLKE